MLTKENRKNTSKKLNKNNFLVATPEQNRLPKNFPTTAGKAG